VHLQLFNILAIIGLIPVYDRVFVPLLARFGKKMTLLQRIGTLVASLIGLSLPAPSQLCCMADIPVAKYIVFHRVHRQCPRTVPDHV
jgi:POT family